MTTFLDDLADHFLNAGALTDPTTFGLVSNMVRTGPPAPPSPDQSVSGAVPDKAIFMIPTSGRPTRGRRDPEEEAVQLVVRGDPWKFDAGLAFAIAVYEAVHLRPPPRYFEAIATQRPSHLSQDEQGHDLFVFNVRLRRDVASE